MEWGQNEAILDAALEEGVEEEEEVPQILLVVVQGDVGEGQQVQLA